MPKLSIIMPTYNGERFLAEQLDSILAQDDDDFELVITDDGSTDGTKAVCDSYAVRDKRIRIMPSTGNLGQNNRLAQLLGEVRSDYVAISDQDDRWAPDRNRLLFAAMDGRPMAFGRSDLIDGEGRSKGKSLLEALDLTPGPQVKLRALIQPMFSAHATIAERGALSVASLHYPLPFDWLMALEALFSKGLIYVDSAKTYHRIHGGNQVNNIEIERKFDGAHVRWLLLFRQPLRQRFWLLMTYLGTSTILDQSTRRMFAKLAERVYILWMSEWRSLRTNGNLREILLDALLPFAGGPEDRDWFIARVDLMTGSKFGRAMRTELQLRLGM